VVQALWEAVLGEEFLLRPRLSRIYYDGRFFAYPLQPVGALVGLGAVESARCLVSLAAARLRRSVPGRSVPGRRVPGRRVPGLGKPNSFEAPSFEPPSFEDWVSARFGRRLYEIFFRTYTEKVWGIPCREISGDWAQQRIKDLSLSRALRSAIGWGQRPTSLIEQFHYPRLGPGMMMDAMAAQVRAQGGAIRLGAAVIGVEREGARVRAVRLVGGERVAVDQVLCSIPLPVLVQIMDPPAPESVRRAADSLRFRHLITVGLVVDRPDLFPDNWVYVHAPELAVGRIQNFGNWSPEMVAEPGTSVVGLEYFTEDGERLWTLGDGELLALAERELRATGLLGAGRVTDGKVVRVPRAYPIYDRGYRARLDVVVDWVRGLENLQAMGRYGMFKYNNSDHSILTALLAVENLAGAEHDIWAVNTDTAYHEVRG